MGPMGVVRGMSMTTKGKQVESTAIVKQVQSNVGSSSLETALNFIIKWV